jgi:hypothetical protein
MSLLPKLVPKSQANSHLDAERDLIRKEAVMGGKLFGTVPKGTTRQFFCLDEHTWIWHEERRFKGKTSALTTRYKIRDDGIFKSQNGQAYAPLSGSELDNFVKAAQMYYDNLSKEHHAHLLTV